MQERSVHEQLEELESEVSELRRDQRESGRDQRNLADDWVGGAVLVLFGAFSALWAQRTGRNAWLWFFLGVFFNIVTVLVLLYKISADRLSTGEALEDT